MATEQKLIIELIRAKMINAKREKEAIATTITDVDAKNVHLAEWRGQEIMAKSILDILEK